MAKKKSDPTVGKLLAIGMGLEKAGKMREAKRVFLKAKERALMLVKLSNGSPSMIALVEEIFALLLPPPK